MTTMFRNRANALADTPVTNRHDKWLFLMRHYGLPTRLLDWTESPLYALYFALHNYELSNDNPTLWIIHSLKLNELSDILGFPNTWTKKKDIIILDKLFIRLKKEKNYFHLNP